MTFTNPVYDKNFPDPGVLRVGDTWFAYGTNDAVDNVPLLTSPDLVHWTPRNDVLPTVGTPATTTWLRLVHRVDPVTGEHRFRSESSTDGHTWTLGGVWTFPAGEVPKIGLVAHGGATPAVSARFDYVRVHQP